MDKEEIGKGLMATIREAAENIPVSSSPTLQDFEDFIIKLASRPLNQKPSMAIGVGGLKDFYDKYGIEDFKSLLKNVNITTSLEGREFVDSVLK